MDDSDASLVEAARGGSDEAFARLVDRYLERCWNVAWRILHDRDRAADVAQEAMATAWQQLDTLASPGSFGGWVLRIARNRALNRLEHERRAVPVDDDRHLEPTDRLVEAAGPEERVERDEAADLVWGAATALGERDASVLDLHLRHGLGPAELAEELGVTANNAHQVLFRLRNRLGGAIRAYVLWHHGEPRCDDLARLLESEGATAFGPATVRVIERHAADCPACEEDRAGVLAPAALFGAVPLAVMPAELRTRVLGALADAEVPVPSPGPSGGTGVTEVGTTATVTAAVSPEAEHARRTRLLVASVAAGVLVAVIVGVLFWGPGDVDEPVEVAIAGATTSTTEEETTTTSVEAVEAPTSSEGPTVAVEPVTTTPLASPETTTTAPPAPAPPAPPADPGEGEPTTTTVPPTPVPTVDLRPGTLGPILDSPLCTFGYRVTWTTTDATDARLWTGDDPTRAEPVPVQGERVVCEPSTTVTLEAVGPGGTTTETAVLRPR